MTINVRLREQRISGLLATASISAILAGTQAVANPNNPTVVVGDVNVGGLGTSQVIVDNGSMRSIVDWEDFSIGAGESTVINQISNEAAILNRVTGSNMSEIYGSLTSNGEVYLINQNGIVIGASGIIETNGFVASTLDLSNEDFLGAGDMLFSQGIDTGSGITVHGKIRSISGGDIFLLSREIDISASAQIDANGGYVGLGAGEEILLRPTDTGDGRISIRAGKGRINNAGDVAGAAAELKAAGGNEYALAINNTGVVRATGVSRSGGRVMLTGGGKVRNTGRVRATRKVVVRSKVKVENKGEVRAVNGDKGGEIVFEAPEIVIETGSVLDVSAALGGGRMYVGGGFQGSQTNRAGEAIDISENARSVVVESGALLDASATQSGDGGEVIVWADGSTTFAGDVKATAADGVGGFAEISGKQVLNLAGFGADLAGSKGAGELLLDPDDITVSAATATGTNIILDSDIETLLEAGTSVTISTGAPGAGDNSSSATTTNPVGTVAGYADDADGTDEPGNVTFEAGVRITWVDNGTAIGGTGADQDALFTVHAAGDIVAATNVQIQHSERSDTDFIDGDGGIRFLAGGDILLGHPSTTAQSEHVAIGSEFGQNTFVAGDDGSGGGTAFDGTPDSANGDVVLLGGNKAFNFVQLGYKVFTLRASGSGRDLASAGVRAANGAINVSAGGHVVLTSGTGGASFVQIGHGGLRAAGQTLSGTKLATLDTINIVAEIAGDINVQAGVVAPGGNVDLNSSTVHGPSATNSNLFDHAKIGHGAVLSDTNGGNLVQGDISGDITVSALNSDVRLNTNFAPSSADGDDKLRAQIGHGSTFKFRGSGIGGAEISQGRISGDIAVTASTLVELGTTAATATGDDRFWIISQIGHGAFAELEYDGTAVSGDADFRVAYGSIANFEGISGDDTDGHGTDITVRAGTVKLTAIDTSRNSSGATGDVADNMIRNQIGHGAFTRYASGEVNAVASQDETVLNDQTVLPTNQSTGGTYQEEVAFINQSVTIPTINDLATFPTTTLTAAEQAALVLYLVANPNATDVTGTVAARTVTGVDYTEVVTQSATTVNLNTLVGNQTGDAQVRVEDLALVDTSGWTAAQQAALAAFIAGAATQTINTPATTAAAANLSGNKLDVTIHEGDIAGNIAIYDTSKTDNSGVVLEARVTAGQNAITHDVMLNRIGHGTASYIQAHDGANLAGGGTSNHAGTMTINQANILGANIIVDTSSQGTPATADDATESDNQDISVIAKVNAGLAKAEGNTAVSNIGHGGEIAVSTGDGGDAAAGNNASGNGGDIAIQRGTIWDGLEHYNGSAQTDAGYYFYGGSVDVTVRSSDQVFFTNETTAALSKVEANVTLTQAGHGSIFDLLTGNGGTTAAGGSGGRGGDIMVTWDNDEGRDYGHGTVASDDTARGIMGDIAVFANHDGTLTGTGNTTGYALDMTALDSAALSKADHNTNVAQIGQGDFFELITGDGNNGGNLNGATGQTNGGRGGNISVAFSDMKIESDVTVDVQGAIRGESIAKNALSRQQRGLVETVIGHGSRSFAVAGDGGAGGAPSATELVVGYNPDTAGGSVDDGSAQATLRGTDGEILRGGAVGGDGGDITIAYGDITDRYRYDVGATGAYYHDGLYELRAQIANASTTDNITISGDSDSDIVVYATHNESMTAAADKARSVYLHSQITHALSEGPGTEVNAQIGHNPRIQAQGGLAGAGGSAGNEQVRFDALQPDFSGGNGGDVTISNGDIIGDTTIEAERQVETFAQAGHGKESIVTALIGHNTQLIAITRAGGAGGDLFTGLGHTDNNIQEYWETANPAANGYLDDSPSGEIYTISIDDNGDGDTADAGETQNININAVFNAIPTLTAASTIADLDGADLSGLTEHQLTALEQFVQERFNHASNAPATPTAPLFTLVLQDLNKDDQHSLGDDGSLGTNPDRPADADGYHDDGIGIVSDGNDAVDTDKEVQTATYKLLFGSNTGSTAGAGIDNDNIGDGVDKNLAESATEFYKAGINPTNTNVGDNTTVSGYTSASGVENAAMVYDKDGNPQFILVVDAGDGNRRFYAANTVGNRAIIAANANYLIFLTQGAGAVFDSNVENTGGTPPSQFTFDDSYAYEADGVTLKGAVALNAIDLTVADKINRSWVYQGSDVTGGTYDGVQDAAADGLFTYVDLNLDGSMDLVDFDADGKFDIVDIDQNGVYDRIDGRMDNTGSDANGNANLIDYTNTTGIDYNANKREGGWSVADLSHADGGRGGNATAHVGYTQGDINVFTGNVNFAQNEAFGNGPNANNTGGGATVRATATTVTDSLVVRTDVQDNIVATGGKEDTVIARIGHGAYQYADTGGEYDDNKVGRTVFFTGTDTHGAAAGGNAGKNALNASGGDGGDGRSELGDDRVIKLATNTGGTNVTEIDHLVGDINVNTRMSHTDNTIRWDAGADGGNGDWVSNGGYAFVVDPQGNGISNITGASAGEDGSRDEKARNESSANRVVVSSKVDNASGENIGIAQIGHGAISIVDATEAKGGTGESGNGSEIQAHQTEIANGGAGGDATSVAHHLKGDLVVYAGRAPDPKAEITSIDVIAEEGSRILPGSSGDVVVAQIGHGRIGYAGSGAGGESDDAQWIANGGRGGDAVSIQREILDTSIVVNSAILFGHGMDVFAKAYQGSNHIVRAQIGQGDINFAESNAGGNGAQSRSSVAEQWNQQVNGGRGGDAVAQQAGYQYDITVDVGSAPDTTDADKASLRVITDASNIFLGTQNHILATIGSGGYSHADSTAASGGDAGTRSALGGIGVQGDSETPFKTFASYRNGGRGGNASSNIGLEGTGRSLSGRVVQTGQAFVGDEYLKDDTDGADITARTHDRSYDNIIYNDIEYLFNYANTLVGATTGNIFILGGQYTIAGLLQSDGATALTAANIAFLRTDSLATDPHVYLGGLDGIKVEGRNGPGDSHTRAVDTNTAQIGHSGFNRADAVSGQGISGNLAFGRITATNADGGEGIRRVFSANIQEGNGGNGGDAVATTGSVDGDIVVTNVVANEANNIGATLNNFAVSQTDIGHDGDANIVVYATGGTVSADHRVDARIGHGVASEALTNANGGDAAHPPHPAISFIAAVSTRGGGAGDASSVQGSLSGNVSVDAENSVILEAKKNTLAGDEGFFVGIGHRLENDLEALGQGGLSGLMGSPANIRQATFKDDGDDNRDDQSEVGSDKADEEQYLLATYKALYEVKQRMDGTWDPDGAGGNAADAAVNYATAYSRLSEYEKSLVRPVLGDPSATGEAARAITSEVRSFYASQQNYYGEHAYPNSLITTYDGTDYNGSETGTRVASAGKTTTDNTSIDHRFGGLSNNEGYGSGKDMTGIAGKNGVTGLLTLIFGARDNDIYTSGVDVAGDWDATNGPVNTTTVTETNTAVDESTYGNIAAPSADELETLRFILASSGDGGSVASGQGTLGGNITVNANAFDTDGNDGSTNSQANARGIYISTVDAALSGTDLMAIVGHGSELIKARGGDAGLDHNAITHTTAAIGGDGGDAIISQGAASGNIALNSDYVIDITAHNNALGVAEEDTRVGHQLKIGSMLEAFATGTNAAVVAGIGGQDQGLSSDGRNGNGGDVTIIQGGASGSVTFSATASLSTGHGINNNKTAIRIFANNANGLSGDHTEVHVGHDQHIDSARAGDAGRHHSLVSFDSKMGLVGVLEGKGGDVTVTQGQLTFDDLGASGTQSLSIVAHDLIDIRSFTGLTGVTRTLIGLDMTAGKEWQQGEFDDSATGNRLVAGIGGDTRVELFDDVDGGEADGGRVTVVQGSAITNGVSYYRAAVGNMTIRSTHNNVNILSDESGGSTYVEIGHQLKLSAQSGDGGVQRGITAKTAGDGGDIHVTRGQITGDILIETPGTGTAADGRLTVFGEDTAFAFIGHAAESILDTGNSGYSTAYFTANYDGTLANDAPEGSATAAGRNIALALGDIAGRTDAEITNVDRRDAKRLIDNTVAALEMALQYTDRLTPAQEANLRTAHAKAVAARTTLANAGAGANTVAQDVKAAALAAAAAIQEAGEGVAGTFGGVAHTVNDGLDGVGGTGNDLTSMFADHADGGDIIIVDDTDANDQASVLISGHVTLTANATEGFLGVFGDGGVVELGHRLVAKNTTGTGGGDGSNGVAGDGGSITIGDVTATLIGDLAQDAARSGFEVIGDVLLSGDELRFEADTSATGEARAGHDVFVKNAAGKNAINGGVGNGGAILSSLMVTGSAAVTINHITSSEGAENADWDTDDGTFNQLGHQVDTQNVSDSDVTGGGTADTNRGGKIVVRQDTSGAVTVNLDLDGDNDPNDMNIETSDANSRFRLGHEVNRRATEADIARSGNAGDDGADVTFSQTTGGDIVLSEIENLEIQSRSSTAGVFMGHLAIVYAQSGETGGNDDEFGGLVDADQVITGDLTIGSVAQPFRDFELESSSGSDAMVGHFGKLTAKSADDGAAPAPGARARDVDADQRISAPITAVAGDIELDSLSPSTSGRTHIGHEAVIAVDSDGAHAQVHSRSFINPVDAANPGDDDITIIVTNTNVPTGNDTATDGDGGDLELDNNVGFTQIGHRSISTVSHDVPGNTAASIFDTLQAIGGARDGAASDLIVLNADGTVADTSGAVISLDVFDNTVVDSDSGFAQIGHYISEEQGALSTTDAVVGTSQVRQVVGSDIVAGDGTPTSTTGLGDNLHVFAEGGGTSQIGHRSPSSNDFQVTGGTVITPQVLDGDITLEVGVDAAVDAPNGSAIDGDDVRVRGNATSTARIGHNHTDVAEASGNTVQFSAGDIWVRARADFHVENDGNVGHAHYDHASKAIDPNNAIAGAGTDRNRIRGLTTLGAGQNSPPEDSVVLADVFKIEGSATAPVSINSGYGGVGNADVDGELRFFMPAQQNLTIAGPAGTVLFNDSGVAATPDPVTVRTANASNVFSGTGGTDHEHPFTLMSTVAVGTTADYTDALIGTGNFTFYFEAPAGGIIQEFYTPYLNIFDFDGGFDVIYIDPDTGGVINLGFVGNGVISTSTLDLLCEEAGLMSDQCSQVQFTQPGSNQNLGSSTGFPGSAGGNQGFFQDGFEEGNQFAFPYQVSNPVTFDAAGLVTDQPTATAAFAAVTSAVANPPRFEVAANRSIKRKPLIARVASASQLTGFVIPAKVAVKQPVAAAYSAHGGLVTGYSAFPSDENSYGEYLRGHDIARAQLEGSFGSMISYASAYEVYVNEAL